MVYRYAHIIAKNGRNFNTRIDPPRKRGGSGFLSDLQGSERTFRASPGKQHRGGKICDHGRQKDGKRLDSAVTDAVQNRILAHGKVDPGKLRPIIFDPSFNAYRVVGEIVGKAFSDGLKLK